MKSTGGRPAAESLALFAALNARVAMSLDELLSGAQQELRASGLLPKNMKLGQIPGGADRYDWGSNAPLRDPQTGRIIPTAGTTARATAGQLLQAGWSADNLARLSPEEWQTVAQQTGLDIAGPRQAQAIINQARRLELEPTIVRRPDQSYAEALRERMAEAP